MSGPRLAVPGEDAVEGTAPSAPSGLLAALLVELEQLPPARAAALRVVKIFPDSAAAAGGLKVDDLILSLAGEPVEDLPTFAAAISSHSGPTELKLIRYGKETTVTVKLEPK